MASGYQLRAGENNETNTISATKTAMCGEVESDTDDTAEFCGDQNDQFGYGSIPINTIFNGMNIHLPAILGFTRYQGFDPSPFTKLIGRE